MYQPAAAAATNGPARTDMSAGARARRASLRHLEMPNQIRSGSPVTNKPHVSWSFRCTTPVRRSPES
jgi:hypothetical protein